MPPEAPARKELALCASCSASYSHWVSKRKGRPKLATEGIPGGEPSLRRTPRKRGLWPRISHARIIVFANLAAVLLACLFLWLMFEMFVSPHSNAPEVDLIGSRTHSATPQTDPSSEA